MALTLGIQRACRAGGMGFAPWRGFRHDPVEAPAMLPADAPFADQELAQALEQFRALIDPAATNALQPHGSAAVSTPWVVTWLLVYQRLHAGASLEAAVAELLRIAPALPPNRRVTA